MIHRRWFEGGMATLIDDEPNEAPITELYAFISTDEKGNDGICAMTAANGMTLPMVTSKRRNADAMLPTAEKIARLSGRKIKLIRLSERTDLWTA
jgi:hypothetical protein